ncbi:MAG: GDP-L-fucose synthase [Betaproteobacteria bacterium]|nr:GDP-L-fucose synthase [Betaproteobacteria bacterium]
MTSSSGTASGCSTTVNKGQRIYVAGHRGLVGSAIVRRLQRLGYEQVLTRTHAELDLTDAQAVRTFLAREKPDWIVLAAAKVGGILANDTYPAEFIHQNLAIELNVIHESWRAGIQHLLFLGSSCIYPRECLQPIREEYLLTGPLEATNRPYAVAKIAGIEMCWAYNRQYGTRYLAVMPTNLYGPGDRYDLAASHVLPALIRKFHLAKLAAEGAWDAIRRDEAIHGPIPEAMRPTLLGLESPHPPRVDIWGSGTPRREFLFSDDMADACLYLLGLPHERAATLFSNDRAPLVNIGSGEDLTIAELAGHVRRIVGFEGPVGFDAAKPDGTPRKLLDVSRLSALGWRHTTDLETGIRRAYEDFLAHQ